MSSAVGAVRLGEVRLGNMGIRRMLVGEEQVYKRTGGAVFIELDTSEKGPGGSEEPGSHPETEE